MNSRAVQHRHTPERGHALSVLAAAAYWDRHRCGFTDPPWTLIGLYTHGRLLAPPD